jgi:hypothetical protein
MSPSFSKQEWGIREETSGLVLPHPQRIPMVVFWGFENTFTSDFAVLLSK